MAEDLEKKVYLLRRYGENADWQQPFFISDLKSFFYFFLLMIIVNLLEFSKINLL